MPSHPICWGFLPCGAALRRRRRGDGAPADRRRPAPRRRASTALRRARCARGASISSSPASGSGGAGPSTITCSPRGSSSMPACRVGELAAPHVSNSLVSSRATATSRSGPQAARRSESVARTRYGASNTTVVRVSCTSPSMRSRRVGPRRGRKPSNTNRSVGSPESTRAVSTALGPGTTLDREPGVEAGAHELARPDPRCPACPRR